MTNVVYFYYACIFVAFILFIVFLSINTLVPLTSESKQIKRFTADSYLTNVFLPNSFGILFLAIGYLGLASLDYSERKIAALTYTVALVASVIATSSIMLTISRLRWAAD